MATVPEGYKRSDQADEKPGIDVTEDRKMTRDYNIVLIGFMGTGKSTVAEYLHREYGMEWLELDQILAEREGISIPEIFRRYGENYFRDKETRLLLELQEKKHTVVSCGGGAVLREENVAAMKNHGKVVLLTAGPEVLYERMKHDIDRPVLTGRKSLQGIEELLEERRGRYEAAADVVIDTENKTISEICKEIMSHV